MTYAVAVGPGQSGPLGLLMVVVLCLACALLFRSMRAQLRRVPRSFEQPPGAPTAPAGSRSVANRSAAPPQSGTGDRDAPPAD